MNDIKYVDLTNLAGAERERVLREQVGPITYILEDGSTVSADSLPDEEREPLTKPCPVKMQGWEPEVIEKKKAKPAGRGRPSKEKQRKRIFEMYPEWVVLTIEREMGVPVESVPFDQFESTLKAVSLEKGWHLK